MTTTTIAKNAQGAAPATDSKTSAPKAEVTKTVKGSKETKEKLSKPVETINLKSVLPALDKSLFIEKSRGGNRENVYHKELFENLTEKERKTLRRNMRTNLESFASSFIEFNTKKEIAKLKKLKDSFDAYYKKVYRINDLTVASILPGNAGPEKQKEVAKMLEILKSIK